jgi:hypothetical protein
MFLTLEQASEMSREDCELHLKKLARKYNLNKPITECWTEVWPILDEITSTLLYLEDRMRYIQQSEIAIQANKTRWGNE